MFIGEIISLFVALSWTVTALFSEVASKRMGSLPLNVVRMVMSLTFLALTLWLFMGVPWPRYADGQTWLWLLLSSVVGYVIGDYCLFQGYIAIGSRFGQLFMTLSAPTAAITGWLLIGEQMRPLAILGMCVTLTGIGLSILSKRDAPADNAHHAPQLKLNLPKRGIVYASLAGICQGGGLVLSKIGLKHYNAALLAVGLDGQAVVPDALLPMPLYISVPFASTMIRATMGLTGFMALLLLLEKDGLAKLRHAVRDRKAMWCAFGATLFGPFVGTSMSLLRRLAFPPARHTTRNHRGDYQRGRRKPVLYLRPIVNGYRTQPHEPEGKLHRELKADLDGVWRDAFVQVGEPPHGH